MLFLSRLFKAGFFLFCRWAVSQVYPLKCGLCTQGYPVFIHCFLAGQAQFVAWFFVLQAGFAGYFPFLALNMRFVHFQGMEYLEKWSFPFFYNELMVFVNMCNAHI